MTTIKKYLIPIQSQWKLILPQFALLLKVDIIHNQPWLWTLEKNSGKTEERILVIFQEGESVPDTGIQYISTIHMAGGTLIYHVFEKI